MKTKFSKRIKDKFEIDLMRFEQDGPITDNPNKGQAELLLIQYCDLLLPLRKFQAKDSSADSSIIAKHVIDHRSEHFESSRNRSFYDEIYNAVRRDTRNRWRAEGHPEKRTRNDTEIEQEKKAAADRDRRNKLTLESTSARQEIDILRSAHVNFLMSDLFMNNDVLRLAYKMIVNKFVYGRIVPHYEILRDKTHLEKLDHFLSTSGEIDKLLVDQLQAKAKSIPLIHGKSVDNERLLIEILFCTFADTRKELVHRPGLDRIVTKRLFDAAAMTLPQRFLSRKHKKETRLSAVGLTIQKLSKSGQFMTIDYSWNPEAFDVSEVIEMLRIKFDQKLEFFNDYFNNRANYENFDLRVKNLIRKVSQPAPKGIGNRIDIDAMRHHVFTSADPRRELIELGDSAVPYIIQDLRDNDDPDAQILLISILRGMKARGKAAISGLEEFIRTKPPHPTYGKTQVVLFAEETLALIKSVS